MKKIKIDLTKILRKEQIDILSEIVNKSYRQWKTKETSYQEAQWNFKYSDEIKKFLNSGPEIDRMYNVVLPTIHNILLKGYSEIFEPFVKKNILIASNAGTQLGIIREGGIIPWDDDIDLIIDVVDYNKIRSQIIKKAKKAKFKERQWNWIKDDLSLKLSKKYMLTQFISEKNIELFFGSFSLFFNPTFDLFPAIKVNNDMSQKNKEEITWELYNFYKNCHIDYSKILLLNEKLKKAAPDYIEKIECNLNNKQSCDFKTIDSLEKSIRNNYKANGNSLYQMRIASPQFSTFDYSSMTHKIVKIGNKNYDFIIADNYEEQFLKEYGENWKIPLKTHTHIFRLISVKFH